MFTIVIATILSILIPIVGRNAPIYNEYAVRVRMRNVDGELNKQQLLKRYIIYLNYIGVIIFIIGEYVDLRPCNSCNSLCQYFF